MEPAKLNQRQMRSTETRQSADAQNPGIHREFFSVSEVAAKLGCSSRFVWDLIDQGKLRNAKIGRRVFVAQTEVDRLIADHLR